MTVQNRNRVLLLFSSANIGGAETSLTRIAVSSAQTQYFLGTLAGNGPWYNWVKSLGYEAQLFGGSIFGMFGAALKAIKFAKRHQIKMIYICGFRATIVFRLLKLLGYNYVLISGIRWNPDSETNLDKSLRLCERYMSRLIDAYISNSYAASHTISKIPKLKKSKIFTIQNGIVGETIEPFRKNFEDRKNNTIVVPANLSPRKGHIEFLDVIEKVLKLYPNLQVIFMGRDDMHGLVQQEISKRSLGNNVHCIGYVSDPLEHISSSTIVVLPSLYGEGCPTALLEASALGIPVVAYDIDGIGEVIANGESGLLFPVGSPEIVDGILKLLSSPKLRKCMGTSARQLIQKQFDITVAVKKHDQIWPHLIKDKV